MLWKGLFEFKYLAIHCQAKNTSFCGLYRKPLPRLDMFAVSFIYLPGSFTTQPIDLSPGYHHRTL
ncbi:hypothetical protein OFC63_29500, partial [Escherichia coli]|nr:hypothetical protein [Escherichia coli]